MTILEYLKHQREKDLNYIISTMEKLYHAIPKQDGHRNVIYNEALEDLESVLNGVRDNLDKKVMEDIDYIGRHGIHRCPECESLLNEEKKCESACCQKDRGFKNE